MNKYVGSKEATKILGVHYKTLQNWDEKGLIDTIRTPGNKRLYNVEKYLKKLESKEDNKKNDNYKPDDNIENIDIKGKLNICYIRVSSLSQKGDLINQKEYMKQKYPKHIIIEDIGSGMNFNKRGLRKIIHLSIKGKINELVVAYKDRLTRFGFELIEDLIKTYSNGKIIILNDNKKKTGEEELVTDIMSIMNVYVAKMNGLRKYNKDK